MPKIVYLIYLIVGICFLVSGITMLWHLPAYQRRVESGEIQRSKSRPSFKTLRFVAIAMVVLGGLFLARWTFHLF
jgi:hypothetical protein